VLHAGAPLAEAAGVVILLHGRGATAEDILSVADALEADSLAYLAPQAAGYAWYPNSFLAERESNEPYLSSALKKVESVVQIALDAGFAREKIVIAGFSQGACLSTEFVATHPARYAGVVAWTGGLIGPLGSDVSHTGDLAGTPALLLSGDPDPHVPWSRVEESAAVLRSMGADVTTKRYPGKPHSVSADEIGLARALVQKVGR
jgi:predicted esterase